MPRYILIDCETVSVFGDSADIPKLHQFGNLVPASSMTPIHAVQMMEQVVYGGVERTYLFHPIAPEQVPGYSIYLVDGEIELPEIDDPYDPAMIDRIVKECSFIGFVEARSSR